MSELLDERRVTDTLLPPERIGTRGVLSEAMRSLETRSARPLVPVLVVALAVAATIAAVAIARSGGDQSVANIDEFTPTEVVLTADPEPGPDRDGLPIDAADRVQVLPGVVSAGTVTPLAPSGIVATVDGDAEDGPAVLATSTGFPDVVGVEIRSGRNFDRGHLDRVDAVAVLGVGAAAELGIASLDGDPEIIVGDVPFAVIGLLGPSPGGDELDAAVLIPETTAADRFGVSVPEQLRVLVAVGEADRVARDALVAVGSGADDVIVSVPRDRADIRQAVADDADRLGTALGLTIGALGGLATAATVARWVGGRRDEFALRRSFGARRGTVVGQVMAESALTGLVGALVGAALGMLTAVGATSAAGWDPSIELRWVAIIAAAAFAWVVAVGWARAALLVRGEPSAVVAGRR